MALITVVILGLVFSILGISLFAMSTYEFNQATYRDQSASAFWLADAAIEHAKAEIFKHIDWSAGFDSIPRGEGWYNLSMSDTTFDGAPAKLLYSQGYVRRASGGFVERDIEVFARVTVAAFEYTLFSMNDIIVRGSVGVCGLVHSNTEVDNSSGGTLDQLADTCRGGDDYISENFEIYPPGMYTEPRYYPRTTYYYVVGRPGGGAWADIMVPDTSGAYALRNGIRLSKALPTHGGQRDSVPAAYSVSAGQLFVNCAFMNPTEINTVFHTATGKCRVDTARGDLYGIVNFGEYAAAGPGIPNPPPRFETNLTFDDDPAYDAPVRSSVFNTRYLSPDTSIVALTNTVNWEGGNNNLSHVSFQPANGIALLIHDISMAGPAHIEVGNQAHPAVFYLTGSITGTFNANGDMFGTTVVLGVIDKLSGDVSFHYATGYQAVLPQYLQPFWQVPSGHVEVLLWREIPPKYRS